MAPEGQVGQKEMYIKIQKVYEPVTQVSDVAHGPLVYHRTILFEF
jgi:hypothetical protein